MPSTNKLVIFLFLLFPAIAQGGTTLTNQILAIESVYQSVTDLSADFIQETHVEVLNKIVKQQGKIFLKKGGKLRMEYTSPERKLYLSDGKQPDELIPHDALSFLIGFGSIRKVFRIAPSKIFGIVPENSIALHLKPRSKQSPYTSLDVLFDADRKIQKLLIRNPSGNVTTYSFAHVTTNSKLADSLFQGL